MNNSLLRFLLFAIYLVLLVLGLAHHEMWRDEYDWFLQARDTADFFDLGKTMSPGHGTLWRSCLWLITRITHNPVWMQVFHGLIASCFAWVLLFKSPFRLWQCVLLLSGYFFLFEYAVISRCYAFGVLFLLMFAVNYSKHQKLNWTGAFLLMLLSGTSVYALMLCGLLTAWIIYREVGWKGSWASWKDLLPRLLLVGLGIAQSAWQIWPHPESSFPLHKVFWPFDDYRFKMALTQLFSAFVPICRFADAHFWNTNFMMNAEGLVNYYWVLLVLILVSTPFLRNRQLMVLWLTGLLFILFFQYHTGFRYARYYGHIFLWWFFLMWLMFSMKAMRYPRKLTRLVFAGVIGLQAVGGIGMYAKDWQLKFSRGKDVAVYLKENGWSQAYTMGTVDFSMSPIAGELDRKLYLIEQRKMGSYTRWDKNRRNDTDSAAILEALQTMPGDSALFITYRPHPALAYFQKEKKSPFYFQSFRFRFLAEFPAGIERDEGYYLFSVRKM